LKSIQYISNSYTDECRFGFNGKEKDKETYGEGNEYNYGFRIYNPRIGKFFSVDPLFRKYPELSTYQFSSNSPIANIDLDGLEATSYSLPGSQSVFSISNSFSIANDYGNLLGLALSVAENLNEAAKDYYKASPEYKHQQKQDAAYRKVIEEKKIAHKEFIKKHIHDPDNNENKYSQIASTSGKVVAYGLAILEIYDNTIQTFRDQNEGMAKEVRILDAKIQQTGSESEKTTLKTMKSKRIDEIEINNIAIDSLEKEKATVQKITTSSKKKSEK